MRILGYVIGEEFAAVLAVAQDGDEAAFSVLWRDVNPALLRYLAVAAPGAAEDVAAETWVQVIRGLAGFHGDERAWRAWLFAIARRRAIDESRRRSRHPVASLEEATGAREPRTGDAAELAMENLATRAALAAISALPPHQAEVILLRVLAGLDIEAVARITGRTPGAVRVAAHRGLRRLAQTQAVRV
jgi:RNA polymerase sigma-70 factor (ECF subfamily)